MADYDTISEFAPSNFTGSLSQSLIEAVPNNPADTGAHAVKFPNYYDEFINKTEGRSDVPIVVVGEKHTQDDLISNGGSNYVYLHHAIMEAGGGSIQLSDGAINTGATDYSLGLIKFTTDPTGDFYVNYLGRADTFAGEHVNALQNAIMVMQRMLGAGSTTGEGIRNAQYWLDEYPTALQAILPNAIYTKALDRDVQLKGDETGSVTITLGNGADAVTLDVGSFKMTSTDAGQAISGQFGDADDDLFIFRGPLVIEATDSTGSALNSGRYAGAALSVGNPLQSTWTGSSAGPYPMPYANTGVFPIARFYGDVQIIGDLFTSGTVMVASTATGEQVSSINETLAIGQDLRVTGDCYLGTNTSKKVEVGGYLDVGRYIHVQGLANDVSRFDTAIWMYNQGNVNNGLGGPFGDDVVTRQTKYLPELPFHLSNSAYTTPGTNNDLTINKVSHVDGLDPSYLAKLLAYRAHGRSDFKNNCVNLGAYEGFTGSVTSVSSPGTSQWNDTGMAWPTAHITGWVGGSGFTGSANNVGQNPFRWYHMGGDYYHGKFANETYTVQSGEFSGDYQYGDGPQWLMLWHNDDTTQALNPGAMKYGARIPLSKLSVDYYTGTPYTATGVLVELSRAFNTPVVVGDGYHIYHPRNSKCNALRYVNSTTIRVYASQAEPLIATIDGITKVLETPCDESPTSSYTGMHYVFLDGRTPETAKSFAGHLLESEPTVVVKTTPTPDDAQVLIGEFYSALPGSGIDASTVRTYRYNSEYDTLWVRCQGVENLFSSNATEFSYRADTVGLTSYNTGTIESPANYVYGDNFGDSFTTNSGQYRLRIQHNFGSLERAHNANLRISVAPNLPNSHPGHGTGIFHEGPDYAYARELETLKHTTLTNVTDACYEVVKVDKNYTDIVLYELDKIPAAIIGARASDGTRDLTLTGGLGNNDLDAAGVDDRERRWWWYRATMS